MHLIGSIGVSWHVGVDALSFPMVWLTTLLIPITMIVEWDAKKGAYFHSLILMMEGALIGVFVSLDLFVFYVFWELTLIPMFFLILMWVAKIVDMLLKSSSSTHLQRACSCLQVFL